MTGATKGVGRGIGSELARNGARVFVTGRSVPDGERLDKQITHIRCDHELDIQVEAAFNLIVSEAKAIDILVNNVWGGYERMVEDGVFTWSKPFWEATVALGRDVSCGRSRALPSQSDCCACDDCSGSGTYREHLVLGGTKAHR
ncbi:MAG: SDR family NAD(P)-dependent oxidoreductase [Bryobacteraceae bacterium]